MNDKTISKAVQRRLELCCAVCNGEVSREDLDKLEWIMKPKTAEDLRFRRELLRVIEAEPDGDPEDRETGMMFVRAAALGYDLDHPLTGDAYREMVDRFEKAFIPAPDSDFDDFGEYVSWRIEQEKKVGLDKLKRHASIVE